MPSRLVVTEGSLERLAERLTSEEPPSPALRELMGGHRD